VLDFMFSSMVDLLFQTGSVWWFLCNQRHETALARRNWESYILGLGVSLVEYPKYSRKRGLCRGSTPWSRLLNELTSRYCSQPCRSSVENAKAASVVHIACIAPPLYICRLTVRSSLGQGHAGSLVLRQCSRALLDRLCAKVQRKKPNHGNMRAVCPRKIGERQPPRSSSNTAT